MAQTRTLKYLHKNTRASTQYVQLDSEDMSWLQSELIRYLSVMGELDNSHDPDIQQIMKCWWYKKTNTLPKSKEGQNSPLTFVSGLINNLVFGDTIDLTTKYLDGIENISNNMVLLLEALYDVNRLSGNEPTKIKFIIAILPIKS